MGRDFLVENDVDSLPAVHAPGPSVATLAKHDERKSADSLIEALVEELVDLGRSEEDDTFVMSRAEIAELQQRSVLASSDGESESVSPHSLPALPHESPRPAARASSIPAPGGRSPSVRSPGTSRTSWASPPSSSRFAVGHSRHPSRQPPAAGDPELVMAERQRRHSDVLNLLHQRHRTAQRRRRRVGAMVLLIALPVLGLSGWHFWSQKQESAAEAASLRSHHQQIRALALGFDPPRLVASHSELEQALASDDAPPEAIRSWLEFLVQEDLGSQSQLAKLELGLTLGNRRGLPKESMAFANLLVESSRRSPAEALALLQGSPAPARDAYFEVVAGLVLERAMDPSASLRFERAQEIDPELTVAWALLLRNSLFRGDVERGRSLLSAKHGSAELEVIRRVIFSGLRLTEGNADDSAKGAASEATAIRPTDRAHIPRVLGMIPGVVAGAVARRHREWQAAEQEFERARLAAEHPPELIWVAERSLAAGQDSSAQAAAQRLGELGDAKRAAQFEVRARLAAGELPSATRAGQSLGEDPVWPRALAAIRSYEGSDPASLWLAPNGADPLNRLPELAAVRTMPVVLAGDHALPREAIVPLAVGTVAWGELVAIDAAIAAGDLELARTIADRWPSQPISGPRLVRRAHLARLSGQLQLARELSSRALLENPSRVAVLEHAEVLLALQDPHSAFAHLEKYGALLGTLRKTIEALTLAASDSWGLATQVLSREALPGENTPIEERVVRVRALVLLRDVRHASALRKLTAEFPRHPELPKAPPPI